MRWRGRGRSRTQLRAFRRTQEQCRKVVLARSVPESSSHPPKSTGAIRVTAFVSKLRLSPLVPKRVVSFFASASILAAAGLQPANFRNEPPERRLQAGLPAPQGVFSTFGGPAGPWSLPRGRGSVTLHDFIGEKSVGSRYTDSTFCTILPSFSASCATWMNSGSLKKAAQILPRGLPAWVRQHIDEGILSAPRVLRDPIADALDPVPFEDREMNSTNIF